MPDADFQHDAFLSYCREDKSLARELIGMLEKRGRSVWWDANIPPAAPDWRNEISEAIRRSRSLILLVTERSADRKELRREAQYADEKGMKLIPVVVGEVPSQSALWLMICTYNQIRANCIDEQVADLCSAAISAEQPIPKETKATEIFHHLQPLEFKEDDIPLFGESSPVVRICEDAFRRQLLDQRLDAAAALLDDMKRWLICPSTFEQVEHWFECVRFYDALVHESKTWSDVATRLRDRQGLAGGSPCSCQHCTMIADRLRRAWQLVLEESCEKVFNCLCFGPRHGSYSYAVAYFECLRPEMTASLAAFLPPETWAVKDEVYDWAEKTLQAYAPDFRRKVAASGELLKREWPPLASELDDVGQWWAQCRSQIVAAHDFLGFLQANVATPKMRSAIDDLIRRLRSTVADAKAIPDIPDLGVLRREAEKWDRALQSFLHPGCIRVSESTEELEEVGRTFPHARTQADALRRWDKWQLEYTSSPLDFGDPQFIVLQGKQMEAGHQTLRDVRKHVLVPGNGYFQRQPAPAAPAFRLLHQWSEQIENIDHDLRRDEAILEVLSHLRCRDFGAARQSIQSRSEQIGPSDPIWEDLCGRLDELTKCAPRLVEAVYADPSSPAADTAFLDLEEAQQADRVQGMLSEIETRLGQVQYRGTTCGIGAIPALGRLAPRLCALNSFLGSWQRLLMQFSNRDFDAALETADELERQVPKGSALIGLIRDLCVQAKQILAAVAGDSTARRWGPSIAALVRLQCTCRTARESLAKDPSCRAAVGALESFEAELEERIKEYTNAGRDEQKLLEAVQLLDRGQVLQAVELFAAMDSTNPAVTPWKRSANALQALQAVLSEAETW